MRSSVRRAVIFSIVGNYGNLFISFFTTVVASRLLPPYEIGKFIVALALVNVLDSLREFNVTAYGVRSPNLDRPTLSSLFGFSVLFTFPTTIALLIFSGLFATLLGGPDIQPLLFVMFLSFFFAPIAVPIQATLRHEMKFQQLMPSSLASALVNAGVTISLISFHYGAMALAIAYAAARVAQVTMLLFVSTPNRFVRPSLRGMGDIFHFTALSTSAQMVGTIGSSAAEILSGRFLGFAAAGMYSRGATLTKIYRLGIEKAIMPVATSAFSHHHHREEGDVKAAYLYGLSLLTCLGWPAFAILTAIAAPLTIILFGEAWRESIPVAQILSIGCGVYILSALGPQVLIATGQVRSLLRREVSIQIPRVAMIVIAAQFGIEAVALAIGGTYALALLVTQAALKEAIHLQYRDIWIATRSNLLAAALVGIATYGAYLGAIGLGGGAASQLAAGSIVGGATWLAAVYWLDLSAKREVNAAASRLFRVLNR